MAVIHTGFTVKKLSILFKAKLNAIRGSTRQYAMSAKAEIEAQIRALQGKLKECVEKRECIEMDPEFTPAELVRWRPSLIGTMLHAKRYRDVDAPNPASPSEMCYPLACVYEQFGLLAPGGILVREECRPNDKNHWRKEEEKLLCAFQEMITVKLGRKNSRGSGGVISLCNPDEILDRIFIASSHTLPRPLNTVAMRMEPHPPYMPYMQACANTASGDAIRYPSSDMLIVIDHYPLSVLYKEWLADKHRGPPVIHPESGAVATTAIPSPYVLAADIKASRYAKAE